MKHIFHFCKYHRSYATNIYQLVIATWPEAKGKTTVNNLYLLMTLGYQFGLCSERYFIFLLLVSPGYFISVHLETDSVVTTSSTMATGMCLDIAKCQLQHLCSLHFQVSKPRSLPSSSVSPSPIKEAESQGADTSAYVAFATLGQIQA